MALIEVDTGVFYDTEKEWYEQSAECVLLGEQVMQTQPISANYEESPPESPTNIRLVNGLWQTTTATGTFEMQVNRHYLYPIESTAFLAKSKQDTVTVTQTS